MLIVVLNMTVCLLTHIVAVFITYSRRYPLPPP